MVKTNLQKKAMVDPLQLIVGILAIAGGLLYLVNFNNWGLVVISIGLLIEAVKNVLI
jgi:hypothetical protein